MRRLIALALLSLPMAASADYLDVFDFKLKEGCDFATYKQIVRDFNEQWPLKYGYRAEIAVPIYSSDLESMRWLGRAKNTAEFGRAWDAWVVESGNPNSVAGKLSARFESCTITISRRGFMVD